MNKLSVIDAEIVVPRDAHAIDIDLRTAAQTADNSWANVEKFVTEAESGQIHAELGFTSWPAYVADVVAKEMPTISVQVDQRRRVVELLTAAKMSNRAIAQAVGVSHQTVIRDRAKVVHDGPPEVLTDDEADEIAEELIASAPAPITGLDGKTYPRPAPRPKPAPPTEEQLIAHHETEKLVAEQETLNRYSRAVDALTNFLSYAKTFTPPELPTNYVSITELKARLAKSLAIVNNWKES